MSTGKEASVAARATSVDFGRGSVSARPETSNSDKHYVRDSSSPIQSFEHGQPQIVDQTPGEDGEQTQKLGWKAKLRFFKTREFWIILALGQFLALCITGTNTLTTFLANAGDNIPAFQSFFNYVLLNIIYTSITIYKYGFRKWSQIVMKDGWKCKLAFLQMHYKILMLTTRYHPRLFGRRG